MCGDAGRENRTNSAWHEELDRPLTDWDVAMIGEGNNLQLAIRLMRKQRNQEANGNLYKNVKWKVFFFFK